MKRSGASVTSWGKAALAAFLVPASAGAAPSAAEVTAAIEKASSYFSEEVAFRGGYVYFYSPDLGRRLGEGVATPTEIWVQPPGTPAVGMAFLDAWEATGETRWRDAALAAGEALRYGQIESGGWRNSIDFDPAGPRVDQYRNGQGRGKNFTSLDDDITQAALRFLVRLDGALSLENAEIHEAAEYGLERLLAAQFANGAFPQGFNGPAPAVVEAKANYPEHDWRTEGRIKEYWDQYTLNDGMAGSITELLLIAGEIYGDEKYGAALKRFAGFLLASQMPDPQPAWAQQYNQQMQPIWARAFEPPAISGRESEDVLVALLRIAEATGDKGYLDPVVPAVKYLESSLLPDGRLARYYELETNRPLFMKRTGKLYELTHDDSDLPGHYGWKNENQLELIKSGWRAVAAGTPLAAVLDPPPTEADVEAVLGALDGMGRWMSRYAGERLIGQAKFAEGDEYLSSEVFADNVRTLSRYLGGRR